MLFIVFGHVSATLCNYSQWGVFERTFLNLSHIGVCSVDLFILISGYFLINRTQIKLKRVLKIMVETFFYTFTIKLLFYLCGRASLYDCLSSLNPMAPTRFNYWFVTKYIGLMLLQPFLSRLAVSLSKTQYKALLVVLLLLTTDLTLLFPFGTLFCTGWTLWWFITLFFVGGYLKLHLPSDSVPIWKNIVILIFSAILIVVLQDSNLFNCSYNSVITITLAVATFCIFRKIEIRNDRIVRFVAPNVFAVYLIHSHNLFLPFLKSCLEGANMSMVFISLLASLIIFLSSVLIDKGVGFISMNLHVDQLESKIALMIENRLRQWLN